MSKWRLVRAGLCSLEEYERHWDICDAWDGNVYLDLEQEANRRAVDASSSSRGGKRGRS